MTQDFEPLGEQVPSNPRILLAAGDEELCRRVGDWLTPDYEVVSVHDGEQALRLAMDVRFDGALLDGVMPQLSGLGVAWVIHNDSRYRRMPIILMSSFDEPPNDPASPDDRDFWQDSLVTNQLMKPFSRDELLALFASHFPETAASASILHPAAEPIRRLLPRQPVDIEATISTRGLETGAKVLSLSPRGAYVMCNLALSPGTAASLSFQSTSGPFEGDCEILYGTEEGDYRGVGLQFRDLSTRDQASLLRTLSN